MLLPNLTTVVDIGANRGQFSLAVRRWAPGAKVFAFEPLSGPAARFRKVFKGDSKVILHQAAIGPETGEAIDEVKAFIGRNEIKNIQIDTVSRWHSGLKDIIASSRLVVSTSEWPTPLEYSTLETMISGKAIVASRIGGNSKVASCAGRISKGYLNLDSR